MTSGRVLKRELWRWYILLFIANELDLLYTYFGLSQGAFLEGNPWVRPFLLTWWPIIVKAVSLGGLAVAVVAVLQAGFPRQERALYALRAVTVVYAAVLALHVMNLLASLSRG